MKRDGETPPPLPLPEFAASLLAAERRRPAPSARQRRSVWRRARGTLLAAGLLAPTVWSTKIILAAVAGAALVAGAGTVTVVKWSGGRDTAGPTARAGAGPHRPAAVALTPVTSALPVASPPSGAPAPVPSLPQRPPAPARRPRESALIDRARAALAGGDLEAARRAIDSHRRQFARGRFEQEREALAVLTLARAGRIPEAQARAAAFRRRFPTSAFLDLITEAIARR